MPTLDDPVVGLLFCSARGEAGKPSEGDAKLSAVAKPDDEPSGVHAGIHAAFDRQFLTVRPDYRIEVRQSVLLEEDGPMLLHGLKEMHERQILLPSQVSLRPDRHRLEERYAAIRAAT